MPSVEVDGSAHTESMDVDSNSDNPDVPATTENSLTHSLPEAVTREDDLVVPNSPSALKDSSPPQNSISPSPTTEEEVAELTRAYIPLPGPRVPGFTRTAIGMHLTQTQKVQILTADLARLQGLYESEFKRCRTAESHCAFALLEIKQLKVRLNAKEKNKQRKTNHFGSKAVAMMLPEARLERERARKEKDQKLQVKSDKENKQAEKEQADMERRSGLAVGTIQTKFSGNLKSMKKAELQDIAFLLGIKDYGRLLNEQLRVQIKERLEEKQDTYRQDPRFGKLFSFFDRDLPAPNACNSFLPLSSTDTPPQPSSSVMVQADMFPESSNVSRMLTNVTPSQTPQTPHVSPPLSQLASSSHVTLEAVPSTYIMGGMGVQGLSSVYHNKYGFDSYKSAFISCR